MMTNKELIELLSAQDPTSEVIVFAEGKSYPVLMVGSLGREYGFEAENTVELGCGWAEIEYGK